MPAARPPCPAPTPPQPPAACVSARRPGGAENGGPEGRVGLGATPSPPPLLPLRLHQAAFVLSTASLLINHTKNGAGDLLALSLSALAHLVGTAFMLLAPRNYWQQRYWFLPVVRMLLYLSYRRTGIRTPNLLDQPATPGVLGFAADALRISLGTRALGLAMAGLVLSEPPAATLLVQAVLAALVTAGNSAGYCSTPLLASPLSRVRMQRLASVLETATLPAAVALQPLPSGASALRGGLPILEGRQEACPAVIPFVTFVLAVLLPTLVALRSWHPPIGAQQAQQAQQDCTVRDRAAAAFAAADHSLHTLLLGGSRWRPPLAVWYCCTAAWWACRFTPVRLQG